MSIFLDTKSAAARMNPMTHAALANLVRPVSRTITAAQKRTLRLQRAMCQDSLRYEDTAAARASVQAEIVRIDALLESGRWPH